MPNRKPLRARFSVNLPGLFQCLCLCLFMSLIAAACADRVAGTSTTAENTVTGVAMLPGGKPAAGAQVSARGATVILNRNGGPEARLLAIAFADSLGRFQVTLPGAQPFFLEIRSLPVSTQDTSAGSQDSWFGAFPDSVAKARAIGEVVLGKSGTIQGMLKPLGDTLGVKFWIGVEGTDNFRLLQPGKLGGADSAGLPFPFKLNDVPPGSHTLRVWVQGVGIASYGLPVSTDSVKAVTLGSGTVEEAGTVYVTTP